MKVNNVARIIGKILLWLTGIWIGLLLLIQVVLMPSILTPIANNIANDYFDASVSIGSTSVSIFKHFPRVTFIAEDLEITYPHERYDSISRLGVQGHLLYRGCGESVDTLASVKKLSASVSLLALVTGDIKLPHIEVESPKLYAHYYDEEHANWNIFGDEEPAIDAEVEDTTITEEEEDDDDDLNIIVKKIRMTGNPRIVYTDSQDSLFATITMKSMLFDGNFETSGLHKTSADAQIEDMRIAGRYCADTLALGLDVLKAKKANDHMHIDVEANTFVATQAFGRMNVPMKFSSDVSIPEAPGIAVSLRNIAAEIATIPATGDFDIVMRDDKTIMDGHIDITKCRIQTFLHDYMALFVPELKDVQTNTELSASAIIRGSYDYVTGALPKIDFTLNVPDSEIDYSTFPEKIQMGIDASFQMDSTGKMSTDVARAKLQTYGLGLNTSASMDDIMGDDPEIGINGNLWASLDSLRKFLPDTLNLVATGEITAGLCGSIKMSQFDIYEFSNAKLEGNIKGNGFVLQMPDDTIDVKMDGLDIVLKPEDITSKRDPQKSFHLMGITGKLASADISYKESFSFKGGNIEIGARNSADTDKNDPDNINYLGGHLNAELLQISDSEGTSIKLDKTKNRFQMRPKREQPTIPVLSLTNQNLRITYITANNRAILTDSEISVKASMNTLDRTKRLNSFIDSIAKANPNIPRDSLIAQMRSRRMRQSMPSWIKDDDFKSSDIKVDLNETFKQYFRDWDVEGNAGIRTGIVMTPYFPLRNILRGAYMSFNNNRIAIDSLKFESGSSEIRADGSLDGLRRVLLGKGNIQMSMNLSSTSVNADELLMAYTAGSQYTSNPAGTSVEMSNSEFFKQVTIDSVETAEVESEPALFVIPGNIVADFNIDASGIKYKNLDISSFTAGMVIKNRCAQLNRTSMRSNMGGFDLDAFYATKSKKDIRTGFCLDIKDVTSEKVIGLMPELAEVMPMVGSIHGKLNCEIAATASLDTAMNIIIPSVNGVMRLSGNDLSISDDELYTSVAKMLLFRNKKKGEIDELVLEGTIKDNTIEVFPFILKIDRYTLGLSGIQNMDMSYKHHVSVLRSPLIVRLGLNISGPDYDHMKFKLGKAQYRIKKMPSFTEVIDQTKEDMRHSIQHIFDTGIDQTISNSNMQVHVIKHQNSIGYINAAEVEMEELSKDEMNQLEGSSNTDTAMEDAMAAAVAAVQEVLKNNK